MGSEEFRRLKSDLLKEGKLFADQAFQPIPQSIYYSKQNRTIRWRRPHEICKNPKFTVEQASRFDLDQGALGNCWYIAAAATLATRPKLFARVVPNDQSFEEDYAGIFRFNFWRYGKWQEVVIDDKLPVVGNKLYFCSNREEPNEFWSALLEKAYAKLHGCYESLEGGWTEDGLVDFTGGVGMRINLEKERNKLPKNFFDTLLSFEAKGSMMGSCIFASATTMENVLENGLVIGHAYSVTKLIRRVINGKQEELVRLRNPWGKTEWNGAWSDNSRQMRSLDPQTRTDLGLVVDEDGEFWMSFKDWILNFEQIQMCHLNPKESEAERVWCEASFDGKWVRGVSAGGCGNPPNQHLYWSNPQYSITVIPKTATKPHEKCWMLVSLMQKYSREMRTYTRSDENHVPISFDLYKVRDGQPMLLEGENYGKYALTLTTKGGGYEYCREYSLYFYEEPGTYVIIPTTFAPHVERSFLLRVFDECGMKSEEMDIVTGPIKEITQTQKDSIDTLFGKYSGSDGRMDSQELQAMLNQAFAEDLVANNQFDLEACRSLLCMMDKDQSGFLDFPEVKRMWIELITWQNAFRSFDKDKSGYVNVNELKSVFKSVGYNVSRGVLAALVRRYGGREAQMPFDDFVIAMSKLISLMDVFGKESKKGVAELNLDKFLQLSLGF